MALAIAWQAVGGKLIKHVALPGSPFELIVHPGPAHPLATHVPHEALPIEGVVGTTSDKGAGCLLHMHVADRMGNWCTSGGAAVTTSCGVDDLERSVVDNEVSARHARPPRGGRYAHTPFVTPSTRRL